MAPEVGAWPWPPRTVSNSPSAVATPLPLTHEGNTLPWYVEGSWPHEQNRSPPRHPRHADPARPRPRRDARLGYCRPFEPAFKEYAQARGGFGLPVALPHGNQGLGQGR